MEQCLHRDTHTHTYVRELSEIRVGYLCVTCVHIQNGNTNVDVVAKINQMLAVMKFVLKYLVAK